MDEIEIIVEPSFMAEQSNIAKDKYVFSYDIGYRDRLKRKSSPFE